MLQDMCSKIIQQTVCICQKNQGPVVQSIIGLMSSLVVKMLSVLVSTISNLQVFLLKKCE